MNLETKGQLGILAYVITGLFTAATPTPETVFLLFCVGAVLMAWMMITLSKQTDKKEAEHRQSLRNLLEVKKITLTHLGEKKNHR